MLPGKAFGIAISLGDDRDEDNAFQLGLQTFVDGMGLQEAIIGVAVEIDADIFFKGSSNFPFEVGHKIGYPPIVLIVFMAIGDKDVVLEVRDDGSH